MELELLLKEIVAIALSEKKVEETKYFSKIELDTHIIRWGCEKILDWLRIQSVTLRLRPFELNLASSQDVACIKMIEKADFLKEIVQIRGNKIMFAESVTVGQAIMMMKYAKKNYNPPIYT